MSVTGVESSGRRVERCRTRDVLRKQEQLSSAVEVKDQRARRSTESGRVKTWTLQPDKPGHNTWIVMIEGRVSVVTHPVLLCP